MRLRMYAASSMASFLSVFFTDFVILYRSAAKATVTLHPAFVNTQYVSCVFVEFSRRTHASRPRRAAAMRLISSGVDGTPPNSLLNPSRNSASLMPGSPPPACTACATAVFEWRSTPTAILICLYLRRYRNISAHPGAFLPLHF